MQEYDLPGTARSIETSNVAPAPVQSAQQGTAGPQHGHNTNQALGVSSAQQGSPRRASKGRADDRKGPCADCGTFGEPPQHSHPICLLVALTVNSKKHCFDPESLKVYRTSVEIVILLNNLFCRSCSLPTQLQLDNCIQTYSNTAMQHMARSCVARHGTAATLTVHAQSSFMQGLTTSLNEYNTRHVQLRDSTGFNGISYNSSPCNSTSIELGYSSTATFISYCVNSANVSAGVHELTAGRLNSLLHIKQLPQHPQHPVHVCIADLQSVHGGQHHDHVCPYS